MIPLAELFRIVKIAVLVWECVSPCVYSCCCPKHHRQPQDDEEPQQPARRCALFARKEKKKEEGEEEEAQTKGCLPAVSKRNRLHKRRPAEDQHPHTEPSHHGEQQHTQN